VPTERRKTTTELGRKAEADALAHLLAAGLQLIGRNYACRGGEIDLILREGGVLVIVEVRSKSRRDYGSAAASVDRRKQQRITLAARHLLARQPELARLPVRFDVVAIDPGGPTGAAAITWIRDAFRLGQ
jgi:putative endonuclease